MDQKICLDTDACITILDKRDNYKELLVKLFPVSVYITTISVFELYLRKTNIDKVENILKDLEVLSFDSVAARKSSEILKLLKKSGKMIDIRDLFIASIAVANDCTLATFNRKHFKEIDEVQLLDF